MKKKHKISDLQQDFQQNLQQNLQQDLLKKQPFEVPEGYFEGFSERLQARIREENESKPVRRMVTTARFRVAIAAAVLGVALISYSVIRFALPNYGSSGTSFEMALMEELEASDVDSYWMELMESETTVLDEEEAYVTQAIDYLAINDVEMVLLFE